MDSIIGMGQPTLRAAHHVATIDWITDLCPTVAAPRHVSGDRKDKNTGCSGRMTIISGLSAIGATLIW